MKNILNFRPLFFAFVALGLGIRFSKDIFAGNALTIVFLSLLIILVGFLCIYRKKFISLIVVCISFSLGLGLFFLDYNSFNPKNYQDKVTVVGRVCDEVYGFGGTLITNVTINGEKTGNIYVYVTSTEENLSVGDYITFNSYVEKQSLNEFGTINTYYYKNNQYYFAYATLTSESITHGNPSLSESFKLAVKNGLYENMSETGAQLAYSVLFGDKSNLNDDVIEDFQLSGVAHLLAVSGLHVSFLATLLYFILSKFKIKTWIRFLITAIILFAFCYLCGFNASVTRATFMSLIFLSAGLFGKRYDILNSLSLAGLVILIFRPLMVYDLGFLLSFFSVFSIALFLRPLTNFFVKIKFSKAIASSLAMTISVQIGIIPFMANYFGQVSIFSILANIICIPVFGIAYSILFVSLILLPIKFVNIILFIPDMLFKFIMLVTSLVSSLKIGIIKLFELDYITILFFYLAFFAVSSFLLLNIKAKVSVCIVLLCACFCFATITNLPTVITNLSFTVIEGQETTTAVLTTPNGKVFHFGEISSESEQYLDYKKIKVDNLVTKNISNLTISTDTTIDNISFKFFSNEQYNLGVLISYENVNIFYVFNENPENFEILNISYELLPKDILLICDTNNYGYAENIEYKYLACDFKTELKNSYSTKKYGSFTMLFDENNLKEVRSIN